MESKGKIIYKIALWIGVLSSVGSIALIFLFKFNQDKINKQDDIINRQNNVLKKITTSDSNFDSTTKQYSSIIKKYVEDCNIVIDGKTITSSDLIALYNKVNEENRRLEDSIAILRVEVSAYKWGDSMAVGTINELKSRLFISNDSLKLFKHIVDYNRKRYGIEYTVTLDSGKNTRYIGCATNLVDTALDVFKTFRKSLNFSSDKKH